MKYLKRFNQIKEEYSYEDIVFYNGEEYIFLRHLETSDMIAIENKKTGDVKHVSVFSLEDRNLNEAKSKYTRKWQNFSQNHDDWHDLACEEQSIFSESSAKLYIEDFEKSDYYDPNCHYGKYLNDFEDFLYKISIGEIENEDTINIDSDKLYGKKMKEYLISLKGKKN